MSPAHPGETYQALAGDGPPSSYNGALREGVGGDTTVGGGRRPTCCAQARRSYAHARAAPRPADAPPAGPPAPARPGRGAGRDPGGRRRLRAGPSVQRPAAGHGHRRRRRLRHVDGGGAPGPAGPRARARRPRPTIRAGSASLVLDVQRLNLAARIDEALTNAEDRSTVLGRMRQRLGMADDKQVALRFTVDRKALESQLKPLSKQVDEPVAPAKVRLRDNGQFALQPGKGGLRMDRKVLVAALTDLPKTPDSIEVPDPARAARRDDAVRPQRRRRGPQAAGDGARDRARPHARADPAQDAGRGRHLRQRGVAACGCGSPGRRSRPSCTASSGRRRRSRRTPSSRSTTTAA